MLEHKEEEVEEVVASRPISFESLMVFVCVRCVNCCSVSACEHRCGVLVACLLSWVQSDAILQSDGVSSVSFVNFSFIEFS